MEAKIKEGEAPNFSVVQVVGESLLQFVWQNLALSLKFQSLIGTAIKIWKRFQGARVWHWV